MNYYALLVALVLVTALLMHGYQEKNLKYVVVACLLLFAIYGLRDYHLGDDVRTSYLGNFWRVQEQTWSEVIANTNGRNMLFHLMTKFFSEHISTDYQLYVSSIAVFVTLCFGHFIYRYSPNPLQSILLHFGLLFFTFHFSHLKQGIAMSILLLAFDQIVNRKPIKFVLIVLVAAQFHFPALVFLPAYWIAKIHPGKFFLIAMAVLLLLTYIFRSQILNIMISVYQDEEANVNLTNVTFLRTKALIMVIIVIAAAVFRIPTKEDRLYETLLEFMALSIVFQTFCGYSNVYERLADYYFQFSVIFIPMIFDKSEDRESLFNWHVVSIIDSYAPYLFCGFSVYRFLTYVSNDRFLYPYHFFFQK